MARAARRITGLEEARYRTSRTGHYEYSPDFEEQIDEPAGGGQRVSDLRRNGQELDTAHHDGGAIAIPIMLVGIGVAVLTAAVAQRFLTTSISEVAGEVRDVDATDAEVLAELCEVRIRPERLEARLSRGV